MKMFIAMSFTGQSNHGVFDTMEKAKAQTDAFQGCHKKWCTADWVDPKLPGEWTKFVCECGLVVSGFIIETNLNEEW